MEITINVEGMMCPHCEARVKQTLEAIDGVVEAIPSHKESRVVIKLSNQIDINILKDAITNQGYKVN